MTNNEIRYAIEDYCARYEIEITADQVAEAVEFIAEDLADREEYNCRCGIYSTDIDISLDRYFDNFLE